MNQMQYETILSQMKINSLILLLEVFNYNINKVMIIIPNWVDQLKCLIFSICLKKEFYHIFQVFAQYFDCYNCSMLNLLMVSLEELYY